MMRDKFFNRFHHTSLGDAGRIMWRAALLGTALYLVLGPDAASNLRLNGVSLIVALAWSYYDGFFARRIWSVAFLEGMLLHLMGVQVGNLLAVIFGNPLPGT